MDIFETLDLQLFADGGGDGGAGAAPGEAAPGTEASETGVPSPDAGERKGRRQRKPDPMANVEFGRAPEEAQEPAAPARQADAAQEPESFDSLIKGKFKAEFGAAVQDIISKRFPANKANEERLEKLSPMLEALASLHGIERDENGNLDEDAIIRAVMDDDALYEEEAARRGMSVENTRHVMELERDAAQRKAQEEARRAQERSYREYQRVLAQAEAARQFYPSLDLNREMDNPAFARLIGVGVPVQTAYEVVHKDDILRGGMAYAAQTAAQRVSSSVAANGRRPVENGLGSQAPATVRITDPKQLTREQRKELKRRAARGEKIVW